jgi:hypothetical protein
MPDDSLGGRLDEPGLELALEPVAVAAVVNGDGVVEYAIEDVVNSTR